MTCYSKKLNVLTTSFFGGLKTAVTSSPDGSSIAPDAAADRDDCDLLCCGCCCWCGATSWWPWSPNLLFSFSVTSSVTRSEREEQEEEVDMAPPSLSLPLSSEKKD